MEQKTMRHRRGAPPPPSPPPWRRLSAALVLSFGARGHAFQLGSVHPSSWRTGTPPSLRLSPPSFQQARLAEQLRWSQRPTRQEGAAGAATPPGAASEVSPATDAGGGDDDAATASPSVDASVEEACDALESEQEALGPDGMLTYQKYLTMQEKRVEVTIRYSAEAGLRPFYLTVAHQIRATHPDVRLERRILPPVASDAAVFEVVVDGKTVIGKKKTKLLKVTSRAPRQSDDDDDGTPGGDGAGAGTSAGAKKAGGRGEPAAAPDIAGGRSVFVSMEKLDQEFGKARKRRRPNTLYNSKEIATGTASGVTEGSRTVQSSEMAAAVLRLERLKAMSRMQ